MPLIAVFDTNILLSALLSQRGNPFREQFAVGNNYAYP